MPSPAGHLIETAVRGLGGDEETRMAARHELGCSLAAAGTLTEEAAGTMIRRWETVDARKRKPGWRSVLAIAILMTAALMVAFNYKDAHFYRYLLAPNVHGLPAVHEPTREEMAIGNTVPTDPARYAAYIRRYLSRNLTVPADFLATARRIDPDNAWFLYVAAEWKAREALSKGAFAMSGPAFNDEKVLEEALALAAEAAGKGRYDTYPTRPLPDDVPFPRPSSRMEYLIQLQRFRQFPTGEFPFIALQFAFPARARSYRHPGDAAAFKDLLRSAESYYRMRLNSGAANFSAASFCDWSIEGNYLYFQGSASSIGLEPERIRLEAVNRRFGVISNSIRPSLRKRNAEHLPDFPGRIDGITAHGVPLHSAGLVAHPPEIAVEDLLPGQYSEHAFAWRVLAAWAAALFGICALILWIQRFLLSPLSVGLGRRVADLLGPPDYLRIVGAGIVLPAGYVIGISRLTTFGAREWSIDRSWHLAPAGHFTALFLLIAIASILIGRRRLEIRSPGLLPPRRKPWAGWVALVMAAISVPACGWMATLGLSRRSELWPLLLPGILLLVPLAWLVIVLAIAPIRRSAVKLESAALRSVLIPTYGFAALGMLCLVPVFRIEDDYWFRRNELIRLDPGTGTTRYEQALTRQLNAELKAALGL